MNEITMTKSQVLKLIDAYIKKITEDYEKYNQEQLIRLDNEIHSRKWWQFWLEKFTSAQEAKDRIFLNYAQLVDMSEGEWYHKEMIYDDNIYKANRLKGFISCAITETVTVNMKSVGHMIALVGCCNND